MRWKRVSDLPEKPKIALIGPNFFSYIQAIRNELTHRGYECTYYDERHSNSVFAKILYRLQLKSSLLFHRRHHLEAIEKGIIKGGFSDVIFISTEVIDESFVRKMKEAGIKTHIYMWDSAKNKESFLRLLSLVDTRSSFEPADCEKYDMKYIPLFAESVFLPKKIEPSTKPEHFLVFSGTLHSHRTKLLISLKKILAETKFEIKELTFYHSRFLFLIKSFFHLKAIPYVFTLSTKGYTKKQIADAYSSSKGVLDIHHPGQAGLTSRTFEALRSGTRLITLNRTIELLPPKLRSRIILLNSVEELRDRLGDFDKDLPPIDEDMDYFLSLERFVDDLLSISILTDIAPAKQDAKFDS